MQAAGDFDHAVRQLVEGHAGGLPEVERERAGDGVDLVEVIRARRAVNEEVEASDAGAFEELEDAHGEVSDLGGLLVRERGGDETVERLITKLTNSLNPSLMMRLANRRSLSKGSKSEGDPIYVANLLTGAAAPPKDRRPGGATLY